MGLVVYDLSLVLQVDLTKPEDGVISDGWAVHDIDNLAVTGKPLTIGARWWGFSDLISGVDHYIGCVGTLPYAEDVVSCVNVGLATRYKFTSPNIYESGEFW